MTMTGDVAAGSFISGLRERCVAAAAFSGGWRLGAAREEDVRRVKRDKARIEKRSILSATAGGWR